MGGQLEGEVGWGKIVAKSVEILCNFDLEGALTEEEEDEQ